MKLKLIVALLLLSFTAAAQTTSTLAANRVIANDSFKLKGVWYKSLTPNYRSDSLLRNGRIAGGYVTWQTGLTFNVTPASYVINSKEYNSASQNITLNAAHPTLPRIDVIGLDTTGNVIKITGVANANPQQPQTNPANQLYLTFVKINAASTTPSGINTKLVFDENVEWITSAIGTGTSNFNYLVSPYSGLKSTVFASGVDYVLNYDTTAFQIGAFTAINLKIKLSAPLSASQNIKVFPRVTQFTPLIIEPLTISNGFNKNLINVYQDVTVLFSETGVSANESIEGISIYFSGTFANQIQIDEIRIQGGTTTNTSNDYVTSIYRKTGTDSVFQVKNNISLFAFKDSVGSGGGSLIVDLPLTKIGDTINITQASAVNDGYLSAADFNTFSSSVSRWTLSGSNIYNNNAGNVGIGNVLPTKKLDVSGDVLINGLLVGRSGTTGYVKNTAVGIDVLANSTSASLGNTAIGWQAAKTLTSGAANVAVGSDALRDATTAGGTVAIGQNAMGTWGSGLYNIGIGWNVMSIGVGTGAGNIAIGRSAMTGGAVTGSNNTIVGTSSGGITTGSNNTSIGSLINQTDITASNVLTIGGGGVTWITGLSGNIGIGTTSPTHKLQVLGTTFLNGAFSLPYIGVSATYTITNTDYTVNCTANSFTITLPTAVGIAGRIYVIKNSGSATTITLAANGAEKIDGLATQTITTPLALTVQSTGSNWLIL